MLKLWIISNVQGVCVQHMLDSDTTTKMKYPCFIDWLNKLLSWCIGCIFYTVIWPYYFLWSVFVQHICFLLQLLLTYPHFNLWYFCPCFALYVIFWETLWLSAFPYYIFVCANMCFRLIHLKQKLYLLNLF